RGRAGPGLQRVSRGMVCFLVLRVRSMSTNLCSVVQRCRRACAGLEGRTAPPSPLAPERAASKAVELQRPGPPPQPKSAEGRFRKRDGLSNSEKPSSTWRAPSGAHLRTPGSAQKSWRRRRRDRCCPFWDVQGQSPAFAPPCPQRPPTVERLELAAPASMKTITAHQFVSA